MKSAFRVLGVAALALVSATAASAQVAAQSAEWRTPDPENVLVVETNKGRIVAELVPEAAPGHVERVRELARAGFYDGLTFFRVIDTFMAQTGDPKNDGTGGSDKPDLTAEFSFRRPGSGGSFAPVGKVGSLETGFVGPLAVTSQSSMLAAMTADGKVQAWANFCPGVLGMARAGDPNSANSQFFFMRQHYPSLEKAYTGFGRVLSGLEVVRAIKTGEPVADPQDKMLSVKVLADIPADKRPTVQVMDTRSAAFAEVVKKKQAELGAGYNICDVEVPAKVSK
ncbi:peptidylprolyl isomerase [Caulobacter sp. CCNWLY153]|jgi:peptidylprolyl isomerase|uniref:peptidylprolyl isomerase n=1 Tax=Caulobacter radicis TaxID=2172650 RepID=A0A2T9JFN2_9CAUL|nr:peptidylprolyl isomerase [Caulobacter radicis]PVM82476.1 peptidylprolyl isomerase [Caulobacter radicis]